MLRRNAAPTAAWLAATIVVQVGTLLAARAMPAQVDQAGLTVLVAVIWIVLAAPLAAASGRDGWDGLLRLAGVADGSIILAGALWLTGLAGAGQALALYLLWAGLGLACGAGVVLVRDARRRHLTAIVLAAAVMLFAAMPLWSGGLVGSAPGRWPERVSRWMVGGNPVFACSGALGGRGLGWNKRPVAYNFMTVGQDVAMPDVAWGWTAGGYWAIGLALAAGALKRRGADTSIPTGKGGRQAAVC